MSLSTWLRDYLFIPLGGSRGTAWQTSRNLLVTMTLGGLWHGANWTFLVWGLLHGGLLIVHHSFRVWCERRPTLSHLIETPPGTAARIALTFVVVCCTWVFFRAACLSSAADMLHGMFVPRAGMGAPKDWMWFCVLVVVICHVFAYRGTWKHLVARLPTPVRGFGYAAVLSVALVMAPQAHQAFIYFQF
jgi:alginate O-acetyltransferase complex protein AlgI